MIIFVAPARVLISLELSMVLLLAKRVCSSLISVQQCMCTWQRERGWGMFNSSSVCYIILFLIISYAIIIDIHCSLLCTCETEVKCTVLAMCVCVCVCRSKNGHSEWLCERLAGGRGPRRPVLGRRPPAVWNTEPQADQEQQQQPANQSE